MKYLAIDLGSSWIKWTRVNAQGTLGPVCTQDSSRFSMRKDGRCEIDLVSLAEFLREIILQAHRQQRLEGVFLSVQMHGVSLFDVPCHPVTPFITWEDTRALQTLHNGRTILESVTETLPDQLTARTGCRLNASLSSVQLTALRHEGVEPNGLRLALLGDAVTELLVGHPVAMHTTNACSTGLYDLEKRCWSQDILRLLSLTGLALPPVKDDVEAAGCMEAEGSRIPIYCAAGDLQASVLGAQPEPDELILNIGTGSQVIALTDRLLPGDCETRSFFDRTFLNTITHIPAGRSLNRLVDFLTDIGQRLFGCDLPRAEVWKRINALLQDTTDPNGLEMSLYFYDRDHRGSHGSLTGITNGNLFFDRMLCAAYAGMAQDYLRCFGLLRLSGPVRRICMIGGISKHSPVLVKEVEKAFGLPVRVADVDECALAGLAQLAKSACAEEHESPA